MKRDEFLKKGLGSLGLFAIVPILGACVKDKVAATDTTTTNSTISSDPTVTPASCSVTNSETEGPFPTHTPSDYAINNIVSDRKGTPLTVKIYIRNVNNACAILKDATVDIWHCDAAGLYSEYGGSGMQSTNLTSVHFLRGRQLSDANGQAAWTSIYPGWYSGRAPHIHVHVYNGTKSLLVTQIAFPEDVSKAVYAQGVYASHGQADTSNARDNVFSDGVSNELGIVSGSVANGYTLTHTMFVKA